MMKIFTMLIAVAFAASIPASSDAAKAPKGCKRSNVRPANPQGSVLIQTGQGAATLSAVPISPAQAATPAAPVMMFGNPVLVTESGNAAAGMSGTVVPSITAESAPPRKPSRSRNGGRRRGGSASINPSSFGAAAPAASSSC